MLIGIDGNEANISRRVGVNQFAFDLLHTLARVQSPHYFTVYLKNQPLSDMPEAGKNWNYRVIPFPKFWTQTRLPWDLYTKFPRPDVFFTPSHYSPRWSPVPTVVSIMDLGFLKTPEQFTSKDFNQLKNWTAYSIKNAAQLLAISQFTRQDIIENYHYPESRISVIYPGYDEGSFKPTIDLKVLKKYGIKAPYILFLSSLKPSKNIEGLVKAFSKINNKNVRLVISGKKAWLFDQIFETVKTLGLTDRVVFTGFVEESEVPALMTQAAVFVLPSFFEGFGIPVVEAMACGTPVVVSNVASLPEVAGKVGIYIDPFNPDSIAEGLVKALNIDRQKYQGSAFAQASRFKWEIAARQTLEVCEKAAGS